MIRRFLALTLLLAAVPGCDRAQAATPAPRSAATVLGGPGNQPGRFVKPRAVAVAPDGTIWVMDRSGRLQAFNDAGTYLRGWTMRDVEKGTPEDIEVDAEGNVLVTETHYARVTVYSPAGEVVREWGSWGKDPGQFIYPVGIAIGTDGAVYVSEYGGNDRVQKFDREGRLLLALGSFGEEPGQLQRPEDLWVDAHDRVWVADACNQRIQVFDGKDGRFLFSWGGEGDGPGKLRYPYDVAVAGDAVWVCEYGNHRLQKFTLEGKPLAVRGSVGRAIGELNFPWDFALDARGRVWVADTQNHRVQAFPTGEEGR